MGEGVLALRVRRAPSLFFAITSFFAIIFASRRRQYYPRILEILSITSKSVCKI